MKHFLLILTLCLTTLASNAQKRIFEFADLENAIYTKPIVMDDITFYASSKKCIEVDSKVSDFAAGKYSKRLKFKCRGDGSGCSMIVKVRKGTRVTVYASNSNRSNGPRSLHVTSSVVSDIIKKDFIVSDGNSMSRATYTHRGDDGTVVFISPDACFNFYRVEVEG